MVLGWAIAMLIGVTVIMLILRIFFKKLFKIISIIWLVLFLASIAFTILIYIDAKDLKDNFAEGRNLYLLESENQILAGFITQGQNEPETIENVEEIEKQYSEGNLDKILSSGDYYKIFIVNEKSFEDMEYFELGEVNITNKKITEIIKADDPVSEYMSFLSSEGYEEEGVESKNSMEIKSTLFGIMLFSSMAQQGPLFLIDNYKKENIIIYEENLIFKVMKHFPISMVKDVMNKKEVK